MTALEEWQRLLSEGRRLLRREAIQGVVNVVIVAVSAILLRGSVARGDEGWMLVQLLVGGHAIGWAAYWYREAMVTWAMTRRIRWAIAQIEAKMAGDG